MCFLKQTLPLIILDAHDISSLSTAHWDRFQAFGTSLLCSSLGQVGEGLTSLELRILYHTSIGIARKVASPLDESAALVLAARDWIASDGAEDAGVRELWLSCDYRVCDVMVDGL